MIHGSHCKLALGFALLMQVGDTMREEVSLEKTGRDTQEPVDCATWQTQLFRFSVKKIAHPLPSLSHFSTSDCSVSASFNHFEGHEGKRITYQTLHRRKR